MDQKRTLNYPSQLALLFGLMAFFMVFSSLLVALIGMAMMDVSFKDVIPALSKPENVGASRLLNTLAAIMTFFVPALIVARMVNKKAFGQLGFQTAVSAKQVASILALTFTGVVLSGALGELNEKIPLPKDLYTQAKALEEIYKQSMLSMAKMRNAGDYLLAMLVLAAAPALCEEVFFRGGLQQILVGLTKNKWAGIIITSILFSAIHFSYFGFLPRVALGMVLGLVFYYSKNLWLSVLLHFLYNGLLVTQLYIMSLRGTPIEKAIDESMPVWWGLIALLILEFVFRSFKKESDAVLARKLQIIHSSPENIPS